MPKFNDNGKVIDSLKKAYNCETINFENWGDKKVNDSCLTICLINSSKIPAFSDVEGSVKQFKSIASAVKKSLTQPYKSFNIVFIKKEKVNFIDVSSNAAGMELSNEDL